MNYIDENGVLIDMPSTRPDIDEAFDGIELAISESFGVDI